MTKVPNIESEATDIWNEFRVTHIGIISVALILAVLIPFIMFARYTLIVSEKNIAGRLINLPFKYANTGRLIWLLPYLLELGLLLFLHIKTGVHMHSIALISFLNIIQAAMFIGIITFMILDAIHRRYVLPKYFPNGKLENYKGTTRLSTRILINIFYISIGVLPAIYYLSVIISYGIRYNFTIDRFVYSVVVIFLVTGFFIMITFSRYFSVPLDKLKKATEDIKNEDYNVKVDIVSCDDFGILSDNFNDMADALEYKTQKIVTIQDSIIRGMAVMVESNDNNTGGHIIRTSECVKIFTNRLQEEKYRTDLPNSYWKNLIKAAPMHDLGKIAVDDGVLRKPGKFTPEEYEIMKRHAAEGARIVEKVLSEVDDEEFTRIAVNVAHYHHEKWNGTGYPNGISREEIPLEARIMALADVFDALVSKRCYKDSMSFDNAFNIIEESLGTHFDPELGVIFLRCRPQLEELYMNVLDEE